MAAVPFLLRAIKPTMKDYYHRHYQIYYETTVAVDPEPFLGGFVQRLAPGDRLLDVGCGSGRDLRWLRGKGITATGFERSPGLAVLARRLGACDVIEGDFTVYDFSTLSEDAILLCGALVHVPHERLAVVLAGILQALDDDSNRRLVYLSLKEGAGSAVDRRGRRFYFWDDGPLRRLLMDSGLRILDFQRSSAADGRGDVWLGYVLYCPRPAQWTPPL
jgi:SAM-dependent methyltransferase